MNYNEVSLKKFIIYILGFIVVLVFAGILVWNILPSIVANDLSKHAGVPVSIGSFKITPSSFKVEDFDMGNPPKSILKRALKVNKTLIDAPITRFLEKKIVVNQLNLSKVYLGLEFKSEKSRQSNWSTIMSNFQASTESDTKKDKDSKGSKSILIKKLVITDIQVELAYESDHKVKKLQTIPRIELTNISSEGGLPTAQITNIILQQMLRETFSKEGIKNMLQGVLQKQSPSEYLDGAFKGLFSQSLEKQKDFL